VSLRTLFLSQSPLTETASSSEQSRLFFKKEEEEAEVRLLEASEGEGATGELAGAGGQTEAQSS